MRSRSTLTAPHRIRPATTAPDRPGSALAPCPSMRTKCSLLVSFVPSSLVAMKIKTDLNLWTLGGGLALATAFVFVVAAIALVTDLVFALRNPDPLTGKGQDLGAIATLVGNMIGAVFSGLLAVAAAFGAVHLERAERRAEKAARRKEISDSLTDWIGDRIRPFKGTIDTAQSSIHSPRDSAGLIFLTNINLRTLLRRKLDPKVRQIAEAEYLPLAAIFTTIDKIDESIEKKKDPLLKRALEEQREYDDKRAAVEPLIELFNELKNLAAQMRSVGRIDKGEVIQRDTEKLCAWMDEVMSILQEKRAEWIDERSPLDGFEEIQLYASNERSRVRAKSDAPDHSDGP